ncbi:N-acetyltransferase [Rhodobacteraceae bacterium RKSG542]|uniref:GNAT family N-acetyltransferase n=1 Tax=Pseudovibrio flavus TaxID=2529854 RepID=UPI0012BC87EC|nr:GNAT family N-acetyltransferase [Pseudovibrio flavus]MTI16392.1 N-acetyltransferase [Pseudovibrio flavus]
MHERDITLRVLRSIDEISAQAWDSLASNWLPASLSGSSSSSTLTSSAASTPQETAESLSEGRYYNPFISHSFLLALESSGCVGERAGWLPTHLALQSGEELLAVAPAYIKLHSQGEYVFDHAWADALHRAGGSYYPKLQCSVPFSPVPGPRILSSPAIDRDVAERILGEGLIQLCKQIECSSVHLTFLPREQWETLAQVGYLQRVDQQFHWHNAEYADFDAFLDSLSSRKRKAIKKERAKALEAGIEIEWVTGSELKEHHWDAFYSFYIDTSSRKWGSPYLNRQFFSSIGESMADDILLVFAKRDGRYIAGALNMIGSHALYGRNWGCIEHHPFLHFELCYYQAIDFAIQRKLPRVEAGAQGAHKLARGYVPTPTYSAHWIAHGGLSAAVEDYLLRERDAVELDHELLKAHAPFKKT